MASPHGGFTGRNEQGGCCGHLAVIVAAEAVVELAMNLFGQAELTMEAEMELELMEEVELSCCHLVLFVDGGHLASPTAEVVASPPWPL